MLNTIREKGMRAAGANFFSDFVLQIGLKSPKSDLKVLNIIILKEKCAAGANFLDFL